MHIPRTVKAEAFGGIISKEDVSSPRLSMPASFLGTVLVYTRFSPELSMMSKGGRGGEGGKSSSNQDLISELSPQAYLFPVQGCHNASVT